MKQRRKVEAVYADLALEIDRLTRFNQSNQDSFGGAGGRTVTFRQLIMLNEAVFFSAYRAYEAFVHDVFLLYCLEKRPTSGTRIDSHLRPRSFRHAAELLSGDSHGPLDWNNPDTVIMRAELFLKGGFPIKEAYAGSKQLFHEMRLVRNHIAHRSAHSLNKYLIVLRAHYGAVPLKIPEPGEFLLHRRPDDGGDYRLRTYLRFFKDIARAIT
jgi:hypothetical protein